MGRDNKSHYESVPVRISLCTAGEESEEEGHRGETIFITRRSGDNTSHYPSVTAEAAGEGEEEGHRVRGEI